MKKILIVSTGKYPNGNAGAVRQHNFAKLFQLCGYESMVIGLGDSTNFKKRIYDEVEYISFRAFKNKKWNRLLNFVFYKRRLKNFLKENREIEKIMVVGVPVNSLFFLKKYATKNNIQLIHDSVEWYSPSEYSLRCLSPAYINNNLLNKKWINKKFHVIAISSFLKEHFTSREIETIRIPVIMDVQKMRNKKRIVKNKFVLMYAGAAGKKDYLKEIILGMTLLHEKELNNIELRIFGVTTSQVISEMGISEEKHNKIEKSLKFYGKVPRETVLKNLEEADFTVLLRSNSERYAKAGFPTKVVESLATGTPVILNLTSDLSYYLTDFKNSIIVKDPNPEDFCNSIRRAMNLSLEERKNMQTNARLTAERYFDYRVYENTIKTIL